VTCRPPPIHPGIDDAGNCGDSAPTAGAVSLRNSCLREEFDLNRFGRPSQIVNEIPECREIPIRIAADASGTLAEIGDQIFSAGASDSALTLTINRQVGSVEFQTERRAGTARNASTSGLDLRYASIQAEHDSSRPGYCGRADVIDDTPPSSNLGESRFEPAIKGRSRHTNSAQFPIVISDAAAPCGRPAINARNPPEHEAAFLDLVTDFPWLDADESSQPVKA